MKGEGNVQLLSSEVQLIIHPDTLIRDNNSLAYKHERSHKNQ